MATEEDAVGEREERLAGLARLPGDVLTLISIDGEVLWVSPSVKRTLGYSQDQYQAFTTLRDLLHADDVDDVVTTFWRSLEQPGEELSTSARIRHADGSWRWIESIFVNRCDDPEVGGVVTNFRDVTDRRDAEDRLRASEERWRALVQDSSDGLLVLDAEANITYASPTVSRVVAGTDADLTGFASMDLIHPDDRDRVAEWMTPVLERPGAASMVEFRNQTVRGEWRWIEVSARNLLDNPHVEGIVLNVRDVTRRHEAEDMLRESESLFRSIAEASPIGIYRQDIDDGCIFVNERWEEITGLTADDAMGDGWKAMLHPDDLALLGIDADEGGSYGIPPLPVSSTTRIVRPGGETRWVQMQSTPVLDGDGALVGAVGTLDDITEALRVQRESARLLEIFDLTEDIVTIAGLDGKSVYLNRAGREFWGLGPDDPLDQLDLLEHSPAWVKHRILTEIGAELLEVGRWSGELALTRPDGTVVPVSAQLLGHRNQQGDIDRFSTVLRDISERKAFEDRLEHQATHDPLTSLPNRTLLLDRLEVALARGRRHQSGIAVLFLDIDHFKVINDSLGHRLGDHLLIELSRRLRAALRPGDTVARFGGDEFVVLCEDLADEDGAIGVAERISEAATGTLEVDGSDVYVGVSMGIAYTTRCDEDAETLLRDADAAMYRAKDRGRGRFEFFDQEMRAHVIERLDIETSLRRALERRELRVFYQPKISLETGRIIGVEALIRWEHPERGMLAPGAFIGVAEETGLIVPIGLWVLEQSCRQVVRWQAERPEMGPLNIAVNLSGRQLAHPDLVADIREVLATSGIDPKQVELEVTESVLMDDVEASAVTLTELRDLSVRLSVDDFGTGYSSLSYLRRFPVDKLKVDRSFVSGLGEDDSDSAIVAAVINLAHTLGLEAVAEGVETPEQLQALRDLGCDQAQGFYMARPLPDDQLSALLGEQPRW